MLWYGEAGWGQGCLCSKTLAGGVTTRAVSLCFMSVCLSCALSIYTQYHIDCALACPQAG